MPNHVEGYGWWANLAGVAGGSLRGYGIIMFDVYADHGRALDPFEQLDALREAGEDFAKEMQRKLRLDAEDCDLLMVHLDSLVAETQILSGGGVIRLNGKGRNQFRDVLADSADTKRVRHHRSNNRRVSWGLNMTRGAIGWLGSWEDLVEDVGDSDDSPEKLDAIDEVFHLLHIDIGGDVGAYETTRAACVHTTDEYLAMLAIRRDAARGNTQTVGDLARNTMQAAPRGNAEDRARRQIMAALSEDPAIDNVADLHQITEAVLGG